MEHSHELMTLKEVSLFLRISKRTLQRRMKEWKIPHVRIGRRVLVQRDDLLNSLSQHRYVFKRGT